MSDRRSNNAQLGSPSAVMNDDTQKPSLKATEISGSLPTTDNSTTGLFRSRSNVGSHNDSSLQLPHTMDFAFSIRQLHSIISPNSPCGLPGFPEGRVRVPGVRRPNSRKMAEPCPRQKWDKGKLT